MEARVWDVTELRRLLCWARESELRGKLANRHAGDTGSGNLAPRSIEYEFSEADKIRAKALGVSL
jgi:hypothetical protein